MTTGSLAHDPGDEPFPLTSDLINTLQQTVPAVLKSSHIGLLKRLAKSAPDVELHVQIRNGRVLRIRHTLEDLVTEE